MCLTEVPMWQDGVERPRDARDLQHKIEKDRQKGNHSGIDQEVEI